MAELPFMPLSVEAWDAGTSHLTDAEDGLYGRLVRALWQMPNQRFPNDDAWLARRFRRTVEDVRTGIRPLFEEFFQTDGNWITHKRVTKEFRRAMKATRQRSEAAKARWKKGKTSYGRNAEKQNPAVILTPTPTPTPTIIDAAVDSRARVRAELEAAWPRLGNDMAGVSIYASMPMVDGWLGDGADLEADVLPTVRRISAQMSAKGQGPPKSLKYFAQAVADAKATRSQGLPNGQPTDARAHGWHAKGNRRDGNGVIASLNRYLGSLDEDEPLR